MLSRISDNSGFTLNRACMLRNYAFVSWLNTASYLLTCLVVLLETVVRITPVRSSRPKTVMHCLFHNTF